MRLRQCYVEARLQSRVYRQPGRYKLGLTASLVVRLNGLLLVFASQNVR